jgi:hypothetical protein
VAGQGRLLPLQAFVRSRRRSLSSGVYICKSEENDLKHGNYICKSEENYLSQAPVARKRPDQPACLRRRHKAVVRGENKSEIHPQLFYTYRDKRCDVPWLLLDKRAERHLTLSEGSSRIIILCSLLTSTSFCEDTAAPGSRSTYSYERLKPTIAPAP